MNWKIVTAVTLSTSVITTSSFAAPNEQGQATSTVRPARKLTAAQRLINAVNRYRSRYKLAPLKEDATLMRVARQRVPYVDARRGGGALGTTIRRAASGVANMRGPLDSL